MRASKAICGCMFVTCINALLFMIMYSIHPESDMSAMFLLSLILVTIGFLFVLIPEK